MTSETEQQNTQADSEAASRAEIDNIEVQTASKFDAENTHEAEGSTAATTDKPEGTNTSDSAADETKKPTAKSSRANKRITRLVAKLHDQSNTSAELLKENQDLQRKLEEAKQSAKSSPEPVLADFSTPKEYGAAYAEYLKTKDADAPDSEATPTPRPAEQRETHPAIDKDQLTDFVKIGKANFGDEFSEAMTDNSVPIRAETADAIMATGNEGPAIYLHLVNNPEQAKALAAANIIDMVKTVDALAKKAKAGKLLDEDELPADPPTQAAAKEAASKRVETKAPTPPDTSDGNALATDSADEGLDSYMSRRKKEEAEKAGFN